MQPRRGRVRYLLALVALAGAYFVAARVGLSLAFVNASATAVWPPTGIAIAALLLFGRRLWPGVTAGAFLANLLNSGAPGVSAGIAAGNTLEAVIAATLASRWANGARAFERAPDIFCFAALSVALAAPVSATIGVSSLLAGGLAGWAEAASIWLTWWLGDVAGAIVVAPLLLLWAAEPVPRWSGPGLAEAAALLFSAVLAALVVFGGWSPLATKDYPLEFLCLPVMLWASFRFGPREAATCAALIAGIAIRGTLADLGPFARWSENASLLLLQSFMGVLAITGTVVGALVAERRRLQQELEHRVGERTEELRASEARLIEAQAVAHVGSWEWDVAGNRVTWSPELYRIYGVEPAQFAASYEGFLERVHPDDREAVHRAVADGLATARPFAFEHRVVRPDGTERSLAARGQAILDAEGRIVRLVGTGQDITEVKRAEADRLALLREQAARRQAEEANRMKDEFLAVVSHELRTPLNAVMGWAQMLSGRTLDPDRALKAVEVIERNARAQAQLIDDLIDVSRFASGQIRLDARPVDVSGAIGAALDAVRIAADAKRIRIEPVIETPAPWVQGDPQRLQQIVWNLLSNAVKFTPEDGRIDVTVGAAGQEVEIRVADNGSGIDPAALPNVFEPFWQGDTTATRNHGGLGLGLAIVRSLVEAHGGRVRAESAGHDQGATFFVRLPRYVPE
jgi:PAS domain S-box-containing protein